MTLPGSEGARRVGPYTLVVRQGTVGGGEVFTARSEAGSLVTVTVVRPELAADAGFRDRLRTAVEAARTRSGAFLVPVVDADVDAEVPWLATAFAAGLSLRQAVDRHGPLSEPALRVLADGLARALAVLHAAGAVHGDVGPDSVLLTMDGPRIAALGIPGATARPALLPADDMVGLGTAVLFAASGDELDAGALPLSLYEVIEGCLYPEPADRPTAEQLVDYLRRQNLPGPQGSWLPPAVTADMAAEAAALGSAPAGGGGPGPVPPAEPPVTPGLSRRKLVLGLAAGGAVLLGGVTAAVARSSGDSSPASKGAAGGSGSPARPASPSRPASAPSPSGEPEPVVLDGPDAVKAWSGTGEHAPTCVEASDTRVMVVTGTATTFLDASTGKSVGPSLDASATMGAGSLRHPAAYADGVFYLLCDTPKEMGLLAAFDAARGKSKWVAHVSGFGTTGDGREAYFGSTFVAVAGDTVYVCGRLTGSGVSSVDGPTTGFIRAFDAATGKTLWRTEGTDINNVLVPPSGTSLLATSAVPGKPALVQMINAGRKGARGWKLSAPKSAYYFNTGWPLTCYAAGTFFICGGRGETLLAVDAATGREKWKQSFAANSGDEVRIGTPFTGPDGTNVFVPVGSDLAALSTADGTVRWIARLDGPSDMGTSNLFGASVALGGRDAQCSADTVFVTDRAKTLWAIDAATGRARWKYHDPAQPDTGFVWAVGGDRVFIASHLTLTAIDAHAR
ncbi:PQQ-binding-like beta-propeller repeat protein [Streptomyces thermocoprophilus]|uniref:PQQ-binding-like beta-propeller repeat protein n=1 Tax=Streptomyces thermocoprophilus TaxID=78356 RepID=A0ABV5V7V7_9ACTN